MNLGELQENDINVPSNQQEYKAPGLMDILLSD